MQKNFNILFVVCHPDDESLWAGGLIASLSKFPFLRVSVLCLSGADPQSHREEEFIEAKNVAAYHKGVVLEGVLRPASVPLEDICEKTNLGLGKLGIKPGEINLLITHSPFGDEHVNPHHSQAYRQLYKWAKENNVPFGYFSCLPIPYFSYKSLLKNIRRSGTFHLLGLFGCSSSGFSQIFNKIHLKPPKYFIQFLTDLEKKQGMLNCYKSIDLAKHKEGYAMFTSNMESLYIFDDRGLEPFLAVTDNMDIPGYNNLFDKLSYKRYFKKLHK